MKYNLSTFLLSIRDFRRAQGQRYPLAPTLMMIIMSIINGSKGYREIARFMEHHEDTLVKAFELKHGVPSHVSVRSILLGLDLITFNKKFLAWMTQELDGKNSDWISMDGKAIKSSLINPGSKLQDFVQLVNVFKHTSKLTIGQEAFMHKKCQEAKVVRDLIERLDKKGLFICLDALHCQKKP